MFTCSDVPYYELTQRTDTLRPPPSLRCLLLPHPTVSPSHRPKQYGDVAPTRSICLDEISKVDVLIRATTPQAPPGTIKLTLGAEASKNLYLACNDNDELKQWAKRLDRKEGEGGRGADFGSAEGKRQ